MYGIHKAIKIRCETWALHYQHTSRQEAKKKKQTRTQEGGETRITSTIIQNLKHEKSKKKKLITRNSEI